MLSVVKVVGISGIALAILSSCNDVRFTGRANKGGSDANPSQLSCTVSPDKLAMGDVATINIEGASSPELFQVVKSRSSEVKTKLLATDRDGAKFFAPAEQSENSFKPEAAGDYTVELRLAEDSEKPDATCDFAVTGSDTPVMPECPEGTRAVGAYIAFIVDNSNSNAATDCPSQEKIGEKMGVEVFRCNEATNRERAVLSAFDTLADVAARPSSNELSQSFLSVASFPTASDISNGSEIRGDGWLAIDPAKRGEVVSMMSFTRQPEGLTPYGAAMNAGQKLFSTGSFDNQRAKVAVMVTDGEPTDRNPTNAARIADELRRSGIKVITVFLTGGERRSVREQEHTTMLRGFEDRYVQAGQHWFDTSIFGNFDAYIDDLLGRSGKVSLLDRITSKKDEACNDANGSTCSRDVVEVSDASGLEAAFSKILGTEAIQCRP